MSTLDKRNPIAKAVKYALLAGTAVTAYSAPAVFAAEEEEAEEQKITITGSRIKRTDVEGALPITVIDREQIDLSGESSAADFLRSLTFNSAGSFRPQSGSSAQGTSSVSLRGIGSSRTLVLVDGRRLPKSPSTGSNNDLNSIPMGAIERIEVLTDGASAVYGSDAMGGVINVITREGYEGAEIMLGEASVSNPSENGGDREEGSILFGASSATSSLMGGVSWNGRDIIFAREFPWNNPGASVYGNSYTTITGGTDDFNWTSIPDGAGGTACDYAGTGFYTVANSNAVVGGTRCAFDFTLVSADEASTSNRSLWLKGRHEINSDWEIWANASVNKSHSFGRYAPVPDSSYFSTPLSATSPNNPTNPAGNVYDGVSTAQEVNWWHRFDALGNRDSDVDNQIEDLMVGATGMVGDVELDFGVRRTKNRTNDIGRNYLLRSAAADHIESGAYDLRDPYSTPDNILNSMKVTISRISFYDQNEMWASAAFDVMEMDAGTVQMFIGGEYREEFYEDRYDSLSEAGQVGGSAGNSAGGSRDVTALYFETLIPVTEDMELSIAGRHDDYSDYGSDFSPKVSFRWQPMDELTLRASYGQGFRAPTLDILTQLDSFSADSVTDQRTCDAQGVSPCTGIQINGTRTANPNLDSENSDQFSFGFAYEPTDWVNLTFDYYNIEMDNKITFFDAQTLVNKDNRGDPLPPGLSVTRAANGAILNIIQGYGNEGTLNTSGFDSNVRFNWDLPVGKLGTMVQWSHVLTYESSDLTTINTEGTSEWNQAGDPGLPENRMTISNVYEIDDWAFVWNVNYIGDTADELNRADIAVDPNQTLMREGKVKAWVTHDLQVNYNTAWDGKLTFGVRNATEELPEIGVGLVGSRDYNFNLYDGYGRITYFRYTQSF
ncbi:MAG: TonB-dependent receptor [Kangiellaceae bacterium]|nr:TonB-dependent receptor [Kangiellaceae bacterium]MCW9016024.1 TonB-dependent receptor [Kangiellaceae bacterium]